MNVTCLECQSVFRVDPAKVPSGGVRARCSVCGGVMPIDAPSAAGEEWASAAPVAAASAMAAAPGLSAEAPAAVAATAPGAFAAPREPTPAATPAAWSPPPGPPSRGLTPWEGLPTIQTSTSGGVAPRMSAAPMPPATSPVVEAATELSAAPAAPAAPAEPPAVRDDARGRVTPFPSPSFRSPPTPYGGSPVLRPEAEPPRLGPSPFDATDDELPGGAGGDVGHAWWATQGIGDPAAGAMPAAAVPSSTPAPTPRAATPVPAAAAVPPVAPSQPTPHPFGSVPVSTMPFGMPAQTAAAPTPAAPTPSVPMPSLSASATPASGARAPINPFLANDPNAKARRLARALVSDMITYHPQLRDQAAREGTLKQAFKEEIKKSYEEYVEQVGRDFAETTAHFQDALNDILASGRKLF